ncbi:MAG: MoxR family ATPase, partial [Planctomycetota bacterium]
AQLDRFMFEVLVDYPDEEDELQIIKQTTADFSPSVTASLGAEEIQSFMQLVRRVPIADHLARYALQLSRKTRVGRGDVPEMVRQYVSWGAGPRASQYLVLAAKARAALHGRYCVGSEDIRAVALPVLRHRIIANFNAEADGVTTDSIVSHLLERTQLENAAL